MTELQYQEKQYKEKQQQENQLELVQSINVLKDALPKMTHFDIPPTPENYAVWYEYSQGDILKLNSEIDELIRHKTRFSPTLNHQLYMVHIAPQHATMLESTHKYTELLVRSLMEKLQTMHSGTNHFSGELGHFQAILAENPDIETLSSLVADLLDETDKICQSNDQMRDSLLKMGEKVDTLKQGMETLNQVALTDQLTGIANRRAFDDMLNKCLHLYKKSGQNGCLLMMDIDHFKVFNDTFGHAMGDKVLVYVAAALTSAIKGDDFVGRFGGEEFVILLPDTEYQGGMAVAEHVRKKIGMKKLAANHGATNMGHVAISIGVAMINDNDNAESIIERADKALYQAKNTGRNKVVGEQDLT